MILKIINVTFLTLYCSLIFWLSAQSTLATPMLFVHQDKIHHFIAYFIMGFLAWQFFKDHFKKAGTVALASFCFSSLYGASDEWHQSFVIGREADLFDWLADTAGASIAIAYFYKKKEII